jgi:hypothetical protein
MQSCLTEAGTVNGSSFFYAFYPGTISSQPNESITAAQKKPAFLWFNA